VKSIILSILREQLSRGIGKWVWFWY